MTREDLLPAVVIGPGDTPNASVIWLHGLGADGHDFEPLVPELGFADSDRVRFIFPHAPRRPVTINGGMVMPAWYDITDFDLERHVERADLDQSRAQVEAWMAHERSLGVSSDQIVLAGFSQGGAIALYAGLLQEERPAGIMALSCYHPLPELIADAAAGEDPLPIFIGHGTEDPVVPMMLAERTAEALRAQGFAPAWHSYPMPHSVCPEEVRDIAAWLRSVLID